MKKILLLCLGVVAYGVAQAQNCTPDNTLPDSVVVDPFPYNAEERPEGGITDTACVGTYYEFRFTFNIPNQYDLNGTLIPVTSVDVAPDEGINNLPASMDYICNPPNCEFEAETSGCLLIFGTPDEGEEGVYDLTIDATLRSLLDVPITVPSTLEPGSNYFLHVREADFENCLVVDAEEAFAQQFALRNQPNPFSSWTQIVVDATVEGAFDFEVTDILGRNVHRERVQLFSGENTVYFDGGQLPNGFYLYSISDGQHRVAKKMAVSRR